MPRSLILVVDDEPLITETLVLILNKFSHEFVAVGSSNVTDALTLVRGIHPDVVLLDVIMPGVHRLEHAIEMREKCGCRVLLVSGQQNTAELLKTELDSGREPFEILAKPIHPMELIEKIREALLRPHPSLPATPLRLPIQ
jgi:CheY-like chemotaxis protein